MDEYVIVEYEESDRIVLVDDRPGGRTNRLMRMQSGTYKFALQGDPDYSPLVRDNVVVEGTTETNPMRVKFTKNATGGAIG